MKRRLTIVLSALAAAAVLVLGGATLAFGGGGMIWDDGHAVAPGSLDDGKELLPQAKISLGQANAAAQRAVAGQLGQVDLERFGSRVVYKVDVGDKEVRVDAVNGAILTVGPQD